jgi:hypothetical protein
MKKLQLLTATALVMSTAVVSSAWAGDEGPSACNTPSCALHSEGKDSGPKGEIFRQNQGTISPTTGYNDGVTTHNGYVNAGDASENPLNNAASPQEQQGAKAGTEKSVVSSGNPVYDAMLKNAGYTVMDPDNKVIMTPVQTVPQGASQAQYDTAYRANYNNAENLGAQSVKLPGGSIMTSFDVPYPDGSGYNHVVRYSAGPKSPVIETHNGYRSVDGRMTRDTTPPPAVKGPGSITTTNKKTGQTTTAVLNPQATAAQISAGAAKRAAIKADPAKLAAARAAAEAKAKAPSAPHVLSHTTSTPPKVSLAIPAPKIQTPPVTQAPRPTH